MDAMLITAACAGLEKLINNALRYDPGTRIALSQLADRVLAVQVTSPEVTLYLIPDQQGARILSHWEGAVDTHLRGTLPALLQLARSDTTSFANSGVEVTGNPSLLLDLQRVLKNLDIDWEEALSGVFGDIIGHHGATMIRSGISYTRERAGEAQRLLSEFLTEELQALPSKNELQQFYDDVDELRLRTDRLAARVQAVVQARQGHADR